jgi:hypothetical protein
MFFILPINWEALTAIATIALVITGIGAIWFAKRQLENDRESRRVENLERQLEAFNSQVIRGRRNSLAIVRIDNTTQKLQHMSPEEPPLSLFPVLDFFEHIALLVRRNRIETRDVWHAFGEWIFAIGCDCRRAIELQQHYDRTYYEDFMWLVDELQNIQRKEAGFARVYSDDDLYEFYLSESEGRPPAAKTKKTS